MFVVCLFSKRPHWSRATVSLKTKLEFVSARPEEARNGKRAWRCKVLHSSKARIQAERPAAGPRGGGAADGKGGNHEISIRYNRNGRWGMHRPKTTHVHRYMYTHRIYRQKEITIEILKFVNRVTFDRKSNDPKYHLEQHRAQNNPYQLAASAAARHTKDITTQLHPVTTHTGRRRKCATV